MPDEDAGRQPFPGTDEAGTCPGCDGDGTLQHIEKVLHWRKVRGIDEDGALKIYAGFEYADDGEDEHISCIGCGAEWELPKEVDYV